MSLLNCNSKQFYATNTSGGILHGHASSSPLNNSTAKAMFSFGGA